METAIKDYYIQLDTKYKMTGESIRLVHGDNNGNVFHFTLTENDEPINLTGATVSITLLKADGKVLVNYCTITNAINGECDYTVDMQALTYLGQVIYSVEIYSNGGRTTTNQAKFKVVAELDDGTAAPSDGNYNILASLIEEVNTTENNIINNETIRQDNEDVRIANENTRQTQEANRISTFSTNETNRINTFNTNETTRQANENVRIVNEDIRIEEFSQIKEDYNTASKYTVVSSLEGFYIASEDNTMTFILPLGVFNPLVDVVRLFYKGAFLSENLNYSRLGSEITLGFVIQIGEQIDFQVDKAVINEVPGADGGMLMPGSVQQIALSEDVQAKINYAGVKTIDGKFTATVDNTTVFTITEDYNPTMNVLRLYYEGCYLEKGISYTQIGAEITLTFPINTGEEINYQIERNVSVEVPQADGSNFMNDSVGITKLTEDVRNKVNEVPGILASLIDNSKIPLKNLEYKGINIFDNYGNGFTSAEMDSVIKKYKSDGLNTIIVCSNDYVNTSTNTIGSNITIPKIQNVIDIAKNNGLKVIFKVMMYDTTNISHKFTPSNISTFFANYTNLLLNYANNVKNIDMFCIGCELELITNSNRALWLSLITNLKNVLLNIPITYDGKHWELSSCVFWDLLDYISINEYPDATDYENPTTLDLYRNFMTYINEIKKYIGIYNKPVIIQEFGCMNVQGASKTPVKYDYSNPVISDAEQSFFYDIGFKALGNIKNIVGLCFWGCRAEDVYRNPDHNFLNKEAENTVKGWWL